MPDLKSTALIGASALAGLVLVRKLLSGSAKLPPGATICVTGCDMGIANETVKMLAGMNLGFYIEAGCLTEKGKADLDALKLPNVTTFIVDVTKDDSVAAMKTYFEGVCAEGSGKNLYTLWNIAGILKGAVSEMNTIDEWRAVYEVNVFGVWRATTALSALLRRTAKNYPVSAGYSAPRIITITSVVAELVFAGGSIYNSSKHAAAGLMSTLRLELGKFGVKVVQVQPWFVNSAFFNVLNPAEAEKIRGRVEPEVLEAYGGEKLLKSLDKESLTKQIPMLVPTDVAYAMIHEALLPADPVPHVVVGTLGKVMLRLRRWLPYSMSDKILSM